MPVNVYRDHDRFVVRVDEGLSWAYENMTREELVRLKTMIEEVLNGANTTDQ